MDPRDVRLEEMHGRSNIVDPNRRASPGSLGAMITWGCGIWRYLLVQMVFTQLVKARSNCGRTNYTLPPSSLPPPPPPPSQQTTIVPTPPFIILFSRDGHSHQNNANGCDQEHSQCSHQVTEVFCCCGNMVTKVFHNGHRAKMRGFLSQCCSTSNREVTKQQSSVCSCYCFWVLRIIVLPEEGLRTEML